MHEAYFSFSNLDWLFQRDFGSIEENFDSIYNNCFITRKIQNFDLTKFFEAEIFIERKSIYLGQNLTMGVPLSSTPLSVQHISITQKGRSFSAPKIPPFHTENSSVQHTPQFHTKNPSVQHQKPLSSTHPFLPHKKPLSSTPAEPHQ